MTDLQEAVVQVAAVGGEGRLTAPGAPHDGEHQVGGRDRDDRQRQQQRDVDRHRLVHGVALEPENRFIASGSICPVMEIAPAASTRPISIEPESPMKIRAGCMLCGRKPRHMPMRIDAKRVAGAAASMP